MEIKVTKRQVLSYSKGSAYSDAYKYYMVYGHIENDDHTRYRHFKYAMRIWKDDIFEYENYPETITLKRQKEIEKELLDSFLECNYPKDYNDCKAFYQACNDSIALYNKEEYGYSW